MRDDFGRNTRVFDPNANRCEGTILEKYCRTNENITSVFKLKNGSSSSLGFSVNDGVGKEANKSYSQITETWI